LVRREGAAGYNTIVAGLEGAAPLARIALLRGLLVIGDTRSLLVVRRAAKDRDPQVRDAALKLLTDWPGAEEAAELLQMARTSDQPVWRTLAFRGYVRLARGEQVALPERVKMLTSAMEMAHGVDDKRLLLAALADLPDPAALRLLAPCLDDAGLVDEASIAAVKVAAALDGRHRQEAAAVLRRVVKLSKNPELQKQAGQLLEKLGPK
jgi:HEAT repeat protein